MGLIDNEPYQPSVQPAEPEPAPQEPSTSDQLPEEPEQGTQKPAVPIVYVLNHSSNEVLGIAVLGATSFEYVEHDYIDDSTQYSVYRGKYCTVIIKDLNTPLTEDESNWLNIYNPHELQPKEPEPPKEIKFHRTYKAYVCTDIDMMSSTLQWKCIWDSESPTYSQDTETTINNLSTKVNDLKAVELVDELPAMYDAVDCNKIYVLRTEYNTYINSINHNNPIQQPAEPDPENQTPSDEEVHTLLEPEEGSDQQSEGSTHYIYQGFICIGENQTLPVWKIIWDTIGNSKADLLTTLNIPYSESFTTTQAANLNYGDFVAFIDGTIGMVDKVEGETVTIGKIKSNYRLYEPTYENNKIKSIGSNISVSNVTDSTVSSMNREYVDADKAQIQLYSKRKSLSEYKSRIFANTAPDKLQIIVTERTDDNKDNRVINIVNQSGENELLKVDLIKYDNSKAVRRAMQLVLKDYTGHANSYDFSNNGINYQSYWLAASLNNESRLDNFIRVLDDKGNIYLKSCILWNAKKDSVTGAIINYTLSDDYKITSCEQRLLSNTSDTIEYYKDGNTSTPYKSIMFNIDGILYKDVNGTKTNAWKEDIPTRVGLLQNDSNYLTNTSLKTINLQSIVGEGDINIDLNIFKVVPALPSENIDANKIYLVSNNNGTELNNYTEYSYTNGAWEIIGNYASDVDLTEYLTKEDASNTYQPKGDYLKKGQTTNPTFGANNFGNLNYRLLITDNGSPSGNQNLKGTIGYWLNSDNSLTFNYFHGVADKAVSDEDGTNIKENYALKTDIPSWAKSETKPLYTALEVGALPDTTQIPDISGKLDTISDLETIRSGAALGATAVQDVSNKQDKLSTSQLNAVNSGITSSKITTYDAYSSLISNKVDKVNGKLLSTNDYSNADKNKLTAIQSYTIGEGLKVENGVLKCSFTPTKYYTGSTEPNNSTGNNGDLYLLIN